MPPAAIAGALAFGAATKAYGSIKAGKDANEAHRYNADLTRLEGVYNQARQREAVKRLIGRQQALYQGSGVVSSQGSAQDVIRDTAVAGERDALMIRYTSELEAQGEEKLGSSAKRQGIIGGLGALVSGVADVAGVFGG